MEVVLDGTLRTVMKVPLPDFYPLVCCSKLKIASGCTTARRFGKVKMVVSSNFSIYLLNVSVTFLKGKTNTFCESPAYASEYTCITSGTDFCKLVPSCHIYICKIHMYIILLLLLLQKSLPRYLIIAAYLLRGST